jgi:hypothetical protein
MAGGSLRSEAEDFQMAEKKTDAPQGPHTVKAGIFDRFLGNRGPNGELMQDGKPATVEDLPDDDEDDED